MREPLKVMGCAQGCWVIAAAAGVLIALLLLLFGGYGFAGALFLGLVLCVLVGVLLNMVLCRDIGQPTASSVAPPTSQVATHELIEVEVAVAPTPEAPEAVDAPATGDPVSEVPHEPSAAVEETAVGMIKPSTVLAGQVELAERKGSWKYQGEAEPNTLAAAAEPMVGAAEAAADSSRPTTLEGPRGGTADDLKRIKGIGPKLEQLCNRLGFYHFDQIAGWSAAEVAWVDQNLEGFKGRVTRDTWVAQAKLLAAGDETEFSARAL
ncbi:hypothetical protein [Puniceibacterium sp. IMCC21224]|uniref:hypothetical protein n=1 Tax=Puniceibacterium sp. IMCC21224 TaxID=1618204 RepID=UPI00064DA71D|nr:hypothetical protein [Puniceibacterium sp. IMCC21224]KMK67065.1 hypothetical protein IMCC21224_111928 [Puniceibacterium sp. IMCC21224]